MSWNPGSHRISSTSDTLQVCAQNQSQRNDQGLLSVGKRREHLQYSVTKAMRRHCLALTDQTLLAQEISLPLASGCHKPSGLHRLLLVKLSGTLSFPFSSYQPNSYSFIRYIYSEHFMCQTSEHGREGPALNVLILIQTAPLTSPVSRLCPPLLQNPLSLQSQEACLQMCLNIVGMFSLGQE